MIDAGKMSRIYVILAAVILMSSLFELSGFASNADFEVNKLLFDEGALVARTEKVDLSRPVTLSSDIVDGLQIKVRPNGFSIDAIVKLSVLGYERGLTALYYGTEGSRKEIVCLKVIQSDESECSFAVTLKANNTSNYMLFSEGADIIIKDLRISEYRVKRASQLSGTLIFYFFFVLAVLGFVVSFLSTQGAKLASVLISAVFLSFVSFQIFASLLVYLAFFYLMLRRLSLIQTGTSRLLLFTLLAAISSLLFIKFLLPTVVTAFVNPGQLPLAMPLGLSYFVIKIIDLTIDVYKRAIIEVSILDFLCFLLFPCTLPAGPIKSYKQYINFRIEDYSIVHYASGIGRTLFGVIKKLLGDVYLLPLINERVLAFVTLGDSDPGAVSLLVCELLFVNFFYIYIDFSAYCDMAIGSARSMGFNIPENFKWPLLRKSVSQYWQNWHMTLSNWARKNVFMNVALVSRSIFLATFCTMLCIGLWHRPSFGWLGWATHHTILMRTEDWVGRRSRFRGCLATLERFTRLPISVLSICYVWFMVALGQSFIVFSDIELSLKAYRAMIMAPYFLLVGLV